MSKERVKLPISEANAIDSVLQAYTIDQIIDHHVATKGDWDCQYKQEFKHMTVSVIARALYLGFWAVNEKEEICWGLSAAEIAEINGKGANHD